MVKIPASLLFLAVQNLRYSMCIFEDEGSLLFYNERACTHFHWKPFPFEQTKHWSSLFDSIPALSKYSSLFVDSDTNEIDLREVPHDEKFLNIKGKKFEGGFLLTAEDVTLTKVTDQAALHAMLEGQEGERRRLAKELHDGIGPLLSATKLNLDRISTEAPLQPTYKYQLQNAIEMLQMIADDLRAISHALMPGAILDFGLITALENMCLKADENGKVHINFIFSGKQERFDQQIELGLYRIAQELIHNALKHAKAKQINIQLIRFSSSLLLMVEDDGMGFNPKIIVTEKNTGIGLRNVKTRTKTLGGKFNLDTRPGSGVCVTIEVPL